MLFWLIIFARLGSHFLTYLLCLLVDCLGSSCLYTSRYVFYTECAAACKTCYYDSNGNNLCAECNVGYAVSTDKRSCERMSSTVRSLLTLCLDKCPNSNADETRHQYEWSRRPSATASNSLAIHCSAIESGRRHHDTQNVNIYVLCKAEGEAVGMNVHFILFYC